MRLILAFIAGLSGLLAYPGAVCAQDYHLISHEGKPVAIRLSYKLFSKRLAVACAGDTLFLGDYQATESVRVLQQRFLQITYQTRCGTGCSVQNTAVVSLGQQKLQLSLLILSGGDSEDFTPGNERTYHYSATLVMAGGTASSYTMQVREHVEETFQSSPSRNRRQNQQMTLRWDAARQIFYSGFEPTSRCLPVYDEATQRPASFYDLTAFYVIQPDLYSSYVAVLPRWAIGMLPVVRLHDDLYYFVQGNWLAGPAKPVMNQPYWFIKNDVQHVPKRQHGLWS